MTEFHLTVAGKQYYENHVPRIAVALEKIAEELKRSNDMRDFHTAKAIESIANQLAPFEPALARLLRHYSDER